MSHLPRRIVAAANRFTKGKHKGLVVVGVRHFDELMRGQFEALGYSPENPPNCEEGFVDNDYKYLDRNEAWKIAANANQLHIESGTTLGCLHSEDLW